MRLSADDTLAVIARVPRDENEGDEVVDQAGDGPEAGGDAATADAPEVADSDSKPAEDDQA